MLSWVVILSLQFTPSSEGPRLRPLPLLSPLSSFGLTSIVSPASALFSRLLSTTLPATSFSSCTYKLFAVTTGVASHGTPTRGSI
jgi:hypothetical protein